jgi:hypothetical protein
MYLQYFFLTTFHSCLNETQQFTCYERGYYDSENEIASDFQLCLNLLSMPIILCNDSYHVARKFRRSENYNDGTRYASDEVT